MVTRRAHAMPIRYRRVPPSAADDAGTGAARDEEATVEGSRFDALTRHVGQVTTRRGTLRSALGAGLATAAAVGLAMPAGAARGGNNRCKNRLRQCKQKLRQERCEPRPFGATCSTNEQCCTDKTGQICALHGGPGTPTVCCGGTGASCFASSDCCRHFSCSGGFCHMT